VIEVLMDDYSETGELLKLLVGRLPGSGWVNWTGRRATEQLAEGKVLNAHSRTDKLAQLTRLGMVGVQTVPFALTRPFEGSWLARRKDHQQGRDFTTRREFEADFWTKFLPFEDEWRIHVFRQPCGRMKVLRSGLKLPARKPFHPWVKSHRLGWKISYIGGAGERIKDLARSAVSGLELDFGAVDIGVLGNGEAYVLEVNTCPGLEGGTIQKYVEEIEKRLR